MQFFLFTSSFSVLRFDLKVKTTKTTRKTSPKICLLDCNFFFFRLVLCGVLSEVVVKAAAAYTTLSQSHHNFVLFFPCIAHGPDRRSVSNTKVKSVIGPSSSSLGRCSLAAANGKSRGLDRVISESCHPRRVHQRYNTTHSIGCGRINK